MFVVLFSNMSEVISTEEQINTAQIPLRDRIRRTPIDQYILYLPNLQAALNLWRDVSLYSKTKLKQKRHPRVIHLTETNKDMFCDAGRRMRRPKKDQRRCSSVANQIIARNLERDQARITELIGPGRSSVSLPHVLSDQLCPACNKRRCRCASRPCTCLYSTCLCTSYRGAASAPLPDQGVSSSGYGNISNVQPRKSRRRVSKTRKLSMVEILRATAIGRLEELGVNQDSTVSIGDCSPTPDQQDPQPHFEEVNTIQYTKRLLPYNHRVMLAASVYLEYIQGQRGMPPQPSYFKSDPYLMRQTYKLALGTFHYFQVIEDLLLDTYFYSNYVQFRQCQSLVSVMLYNLKILGFKAPRQYQCEFGETVREVQDVHEALIRFKTKFHAAFARCRIKCNAYQEDLLMSDDIRIRYRSDTNSPRHVRVNSLRKNKDQVIMTLENRGYTKLAPLEPWSPFSFYCDPLIDNLLVFSPDSKDDLTYFALVQDGSLLLQDKSTVVASSILHNLISPSGGTSSDDVIVTDIGTGNCACYLAALQSKEGSVLAFGPQPDCTEKLLAKSDTLNASNVHIVNEPFLQSSCKDNIFKGVRGILCNPPSSLSGVVDVVELVVEEGEKILPTIAKGPADTTLLPRYVTTQYLTLKHALSFPKVNTVVYFTRAIHPQENEHVIRKIVDELNDSSDDSPFRLVPVDSKVRESVIPETSFYEPLINMKNIAPDISGKCLRVLPTTDLGGFFIAAFQRMAAKPSTILERAMEKGTLGGEASSASAKKHKKNRKSKKMMKETSMDPTTASMIKVRGKSRKSARKKNG